jgi:hypothetical protein
MGDRCGKTFRADEYRLHSGLMSRIVFWFVIAFALFMLTRWIVLNAVWIVNTLG